MVHAVQPGRSAAALVPGPSIACEATMAERSHTYGAACSSVGNVAVRLLYGSSTAPAEMYVTPNVARMRGDRVFAARNRVRRECRATAETMCDSWHSVWKYAARPTNCFIRPPRLCGTDWRIDKTPCRRRISRCRQAQAKRASRRRTNPTVRCTSETFATSNRRLCRGRSP